MQRIPVAVTWWCGLCKLCMQQLQNMRTHRFFQLRDRWTCTCGFGLYSMCKIWGWKIVKSDPLSCTDALNFCMSFGTKCRVSTIVTPATCAATPELRCLLASCGWENSFSTWDGTTFLRAKAGTAVARLSHRNSVRLSVKPVCHANKPVKKRCKLGSPNLHGLLPGL